MRSKTTSIKQPWALAEAGKRRAEQLGYPSFNAYISGLIRYDLLVRGEHTITRPIAQMDLDAQDKVDSELLEIEKSGKGRRGVLLEALIDRAMTRGAKTKEEVRKQLPKELG